jgi:D-alanyl-lipoteichoic acid acyltransferase DltB (MBOAT superfamily)
MSLPTLAVADEPLLIWIPFVVVFSVAIPLFPGLQKSSNLWLFCLVGAAAYHLQRFTGFVAVLGIAYAFVRSLSALRLRPIRWRWTCIALVSLVLVFTLGRVFDWGRLISLPGARSVALYSLDMWLALRLVTLFWEVGAGIVAAPPLTAFILWTCLPFTLAGPILRYSEFPETICVNRSLWKSSNWWLELVAGAAKLLAGMLLPAEHDVVFHRWPQAHLLRKGVSIFFTAPFSFYLTTAGYFTLMEVLARPAGFKVPSSFNFPIGRQNISEFWMNWNTTVTRVFRDYLFYNRWGLQGYNMYLNVVVLFTLVGLWHAANAYWILWGFMHGLLFCGFLFWRKYGSRLGQIPLRGTPAARATASILTYVSVCLCWYLPSKILQKLGVL